MAIQINSETPYLVSASEMVINLNNALFAEWTGSNELTVTFVGGVVKTFSKVDENNFNESLSVIELTSAQ